MKNCRRMADDVSASINNFAEIDRLLAEGAVELGRLRQLPFEVGLGVGRELPLAGVGLRVGAAEEGGEFGAAGVAQDVHQEEPVGGTGEAGTEHRVGPGVAVDVRDAERFVAEDRHPGARFESRGDFAGGHAEGRILEVVRDLVFGESRGGVEQVFVERLLVGEVRW